MTFDSVIGHFSRNASQRDKVFVRRMTVDTPDDQPVDLYFKLYRYRRPSWRFWCRRSKARGEYQNYRRLKDLGAPVADRVAAAEQRDMLGRLRSAWIITRAVPQSQTLLQFMADQPPEAARRQIVAELAEITRRLHRAGFAHHDLVWRNILVSCFGRHPKLYLIDCPRGGFRRLRMPWRRIRDLAALDRSAIQYCRRTERLRFLLIYLGKSHCDDEVRRLARACHRYHRKRGKVTG